MIPVYDDRDTEEGHEMREGCNISSLLIMIITVLFICVVAYCVLTTLHPVVRIPPHEIR